MDISKYQIFSSVAKHQSLSKAAKELGYTQSGISHTLARMEQELDLSLFERNRNGAALTPAGRELLPFITQIVQCQENLEQTVSALHHLEKGTLSIGTYSSVARKWLPYIIRNFKNDYPSVTIHFKEGGNEEILQWINDGEVDLGFLSVTESDRSKIEWIPLARDPLLAILPPEYPLTEKDIFPIERFNHQTFIISTFGIDYDIHNMLKTNHITPDIQYTAKDDYTILSMVECGLGMSILPKLILDFAPYHAKALPLKPYASRMLGIAIPSLKLSSPATRTFINYAQAYLSSLSS